MLLPCHAQERMRFMTAASNVGSFDKAARITWSVVLNLLKNRRNIKWISN